MRSSPPSPRPARTISRAPRDAGALRSTVGGAGRDDSARARRYKRGALPNLELQHTRGFTALVRRLALTTVTTAALAGGPALVGCGGSDSANDPKRFIGTWVADAGELKITCPLPVPLPAQSLKGESLTIGAGTDTPLVTTVRGCVVKFDVSGDIAIAKPGQSCTTSAMIPGTTSALSFTLTVSSATFTNHGSTGDFAQNGSATTTGVPTLGTLTCSYELNANATKSAPTSTSTSTPTTP